MITKETLKFLKDNPEIQEIIEGYSKSYKVDVVPELSRGMLKLSLWKDGSAVYNIYCYTHRSNLIEFLHGEFNLYREISAYGCRGGAT